MVSPVKTTERVVHRLSPEAYQQLERMLPPPLVDNETSQIASGFRLGVQAVLKLVREGFAVS